MHKIELNIVAYQEGNTWVAQCVEHDIYARANSLPKLPRALERAIATNACINAELGREGFDGIPPAPKRFWNMFEQAKMKIQDGANRICTSQGEVKLGDLRVAECM